MDNGQFVNFYHIQPCFGPVEENATMSMLCVDARILLHVFEYPEKTRYSEIYHFHILIKFGKNLNFPE